MEFDKIVIAQVFMEYRIEKYVIFNDKDVEERGWEDVSVLFDRIGIDVGGAIF